MSYRGLFHFIFSLFCIYICFIMRSFTLLELLVVIMVIAILASLLLPALKTAMKSVDSIQCIANMKNIGSAIGMYTMDFNDYLPMHTSGNEEYKDFEHATIPKGTQFKNWIYNYSGNPSRKNTLSSDYANPTWCAQIVWLYLNQDGGSFMCPDLLDAWKKNGKYAYQVRSWTENSYHSPGIPSTHKTSTVFFMEGGAATYTIRPVRFTKLAADNPHGFLLYCHYMDYRNLSGVAKLRHDGRLNKMGTDLSVQKLPWSTAVKQDYELNTEVVRRGGK